MRKVLINAANLHVGGGVQVAASFIIELSRMVGLLNSCEIFVYVSSAVDENLTAVGFNKVGYRNYRVFNVYGIEALKPNVAKKYYGYDLVFTIFGPLYLPRPVPNHVVGFAQPWIIYPNNEVSSRLTIWQKFKLWLKYHIQWWFFKRSERLVVELYHVKKRLVGLKNFPAHRIDVVSNCVSEVYFDRNKWAQLTKGFDFEENVINIGYVTRDYPHKNLNFLVDVSRELKRISNYKYRFFVTLTNNEWISRDSDFKECVTNVGPLNVAQCPTFYEAMDAVFFPSLLECFSATPLEAMVMKRPLFASNREFVRDSCLDNAVYFDPLDAQEAAKCIDSWFGGNDSESKNIKVNRAHKHVMSLPNNGDRATAYIDIIRNVLKL